MLFNSFEFLLFFFPLTLLGFYLLGTLKSLFLVRAWLIGCSLLFHAYWKASYTWLFVASMIVNYLIGLYCQPNHKKIHHPFKRKLALIVGITFNLSLLAYFKYAGFFAGMLSLIGYYPMDVGEIILPLAISFYTFQQIAYLVDTYRSKQETHYSFFQYVSYLAFFPHLIAGPIVKHTSLIHQLNHPKLYQFKLNNLLSGLVIILIGLFKKTILADTAALYVNPIFAAASNGQVGFIESWIGVILFSFVIYFDFSGYSDMAIGLARTFNIRFPENFASPYKARNIIEFWQKWHITLSSFLRHYLYVPLGGNQNGLLHQHKNLLITMLLGGLWHGAGWNFIIWGGLHGVYLIIAHTWKKLNSPIPLNFFTARLLTFLAVVIAWVFFRANTLAQAKTIVIGLFGGSGFYTSTPLPEGIFNHSLISSIVLCLSLLLFVNLAPNTQQFMRLFRPTIGKLSLNKSTLLNKFIWTFNPLYMYSLTAIACLTMTRLQNIQSFIYFRF